MGQHALVLDGIRSPCAHYALIHYMLCANTCAVMMLFTCQQLHRDYTYKPQSSVCYDCWLSAAACASAWGGASHAELPCL